MKLLLDTCIWDGAADVVRAGGHDVIWSGNWDQDPETKNFSTSPLPKVEFS